ncbi:hypothetical protein D623_10009004 [Myotis brandtii]|uniref:Uncharacterized protein n=1 Tax=Myotis brandtii TaxID=109478 RepID=S7NJV6_MYOBR|nr:hypothetical protein D623_10009004 [Myotis brandtii]
MQTCREGPGEQQGEASLGRGHCFQRREGVWPRQDKPPGWALANKPSRGRLHVLGPAGVQAAGQRLQSVTAPGTLPFTDVLLPRMRTGKGLHREKHEPVFAGWIPQLQFGGKGAEDHRSLAHTC